MKIIALLFAIIILYAIITEIIAYRYEKWWTYHHHMNFPLKWKGKTIWFSRSCAVVCFIFGKNKTDEWCVLVNKRGEGTLDYQGKWNAPCGYIDFNENGEKASCREVFEETGIKLDERAVKFHSVDTNPTSNRQNITLRYYTKINGNIEDNSNFSTDNMEEGEVSEIQWVKLSDVDKFDWAFGHNALIKQIFEEIS